ncbi:uncharacterized protein LOC119834097 [Zerene cesonia]|uniref:uncharacterized protein LOC119834097 n=1 Tax=Zerene cesonia TaxID=33412 RepID=UPI0018E51234|nr:uncharacterized protein LOC119834097 [Zerene cesonia]
MKVSVFVFVCAFVGILCDADISFIQPCHSYDCACLKSSAQQALPYIAAGIPELGMGTLDPMNVAHVATNQQGLDIDFRNTVVKGLRHCLVLDLAMQQGHISIDLQCSVVLTGDYSLNGNLMDFQIDGNGPYDIIIRDIVVQVVLDTDLREEGGDTYLNIRNWSHSAHVLTNVKFHFENLLPGNKRLAKTVAHLANSNWRVIFDEMAPPIVKAIVARIVKETSKLFDNVPLNKLSLDYE